MKLRNDQEEDLKNGRSDVLIKDLTCHVKIGQSFSLLNTPTSLHQQQVTTKENHTYVER